MTIPPDKSPDPISGGKPLGPVEKQSPSGFESHMQGAPNTPKSSSPTPGTSGPSPMEIASGPSFQTTSPTFQSVLAQSRMVQDSLGTIEQQLNTKDLKLKRSQTHLLRQKLGDAQEYIRSAQGRLGVDAPPMKTTPGANAIGRFLAYVNDGQEQLIAVQQQLKELAAKGQQLSAGDMMTVQVRMGLAQQELEFSSSLLRQVIDAMKQVINTQL